MKFRYLNRLEKIIITLLTLIVFISLFGVFFKFFQQFSDKEAAKGGVYSEGVVGKFQYLNPVFSDLNPIDKDISALLFSGLTKYSPITKDIEDNLAIHTLDVAKKVYTFTLKNDLKWADGELLSADDIMFTFQEVIQNKDFKNSLLRENFKGIEIKKINDKTVTFTLQKPYKFFLTNLTIGLLPKHILEGVPISNLNLSEFNFLNPIGTGPYTISSITRAHGADKVSLKINEYYSGEKPKITGVDFYIFPSFELLIQNINLLDGVFDIKSEDIKTLKNQSQFDIYNITLPQYVAAFLNTESLFLKNNKTRLGLALSVDKEAILSNINQSYKIDTPFMELNQSDWIFKFDKTKAQGGLNDGGWKLPWKQNVEDENEYIDEDPKYITGPNNGNNYATKEEEFYIEGNTPEGTKEVFINGYKLKLYYEGKKSFAYKASIALGTLIEGEKKYKVEITNSNNEKTTLDTITIFYSKSEEEVKQKQNKYTNEFELKHKKIEEQKNKEAERIKISKEQPFRINDSGEIFEINIVTSKSPEEYTKIAGMLQKMWEEIGVKSNIKVLEIEKLQEAVFKRDYDVLIFGQNLGYNLDSYPYWHSSQAKLGFNFSQLKSFEVDTILEEIRSTHDETKRQNKLNEVEKALTKEMPAIFFYSPEKVFSLSKRVKTPGFSNLRDTQDRFYNISDWYVNERRHLKQGTGIKEFLIWINNELRN